MWKCGERAGNRSGIRERGLKAAVFSLAGPRRVMHAAGKGGTTSRLRIQPSFRGQENCREPAGDGDGSLLP